MRSCNGDMSFLYIWLATIEMQLWLIHFVYQSLAIDRITFESQIAAALTSVHHDSTVARPDHRGCQTRQRHNEARCYRPCNVEQIHQMVPIRFQI